MLQNLHVKNLALIDETEVEFTDGLNILSGETGAGKSIIIGSINLALGEKVPKEMLRDNGESAFVELIFHVDNERTRKGLLSLDVELEDDTVILSRKITSGRAVGRVNGEAVSVSRIREIASYLIDIHGQHEHQSLLSRKKHLDILDEYAKDRFGGKKEQLAEAFHEYKRIKEEYEQSNLNTEEQRRELSFLEYEVNEIEQAHLTEGEDEQLEEAYRKFANGRKIMEALSNAQAATDGELESASQLVGYAARELGTVSSFDPQIAALEQQLMEIDSLLGDFNRELSGYLADTEFDGESFYETEKRLDLVNHLKSKYGDSVAEVLRVCEEKQKRIEVLNDYDSYLKSLLQNMEEKEQELRVLCSEISEIRKNAAQELSSAIKEALKDLNFLNVEFSIEFFGTGTYTAKGTDDVQFMISTNPGEPLRPLDKIASGGEMSRIMLAIKTVMAESDGIETLIFDEIDSGISGRTAQMVSEKMNELGKSHQIICITHLPQIAAMADTHFLIEKNVENQATVSNIFRLEGEECVNELARMLGGVEITDTVLNNAREMKELAYMKK